MGVNDQQKYNNGCNDIEFIECDQKNIEVRLMVTSFAYFLALIVFYSSKNLIFIN